MSFNIFDFPRKSDITVGYVDPTLGYVTGVSICDANEYAKKNPGTTFVFETRDGIRYLNINEVNQLTPKDLPSSADTCTGIIVEGRAESPSVTFSGCGGVGAAGNPVFGRDGSLLGVDLISGGFGYQCPPLVEVRDETGLGVGAVIRSILVGDPEYPDCTFVDTFEVFDQEDDFEDYQICDPVDDVGYGTRYDPDGKPIGRWEPTLYATLSRDPIAREIQRYQDFLQQLSTPWWTTRKENPLRVTSGNRTTRIKHDVQHPGWGGEYGIERGEDFKEVTFNVFVSGGQDKGLALKFTSEDKSHTFKIKADDFKNNETGQKVTERVKINTIYNVSSEGSFQGKGTEKGIINALGRGAREKNPTGKEVVINGSTIFADFLESSNDNDDLQVEATLGKFTSKQIGKGSSRSNFDLKYELKDNASYTKPAKIDDSFMNKYAISPVPPSSAPGSDFAGQEFTMEWEENFPYDGEYVFRAQADNIGRYYLDNEKLIETTQFKSDQTPKVVKKNVKAGVHRIRLDLFNIPIKEKVVKQVITQPPTPDQKPFKITAAYTGVKNLVNNFKAGIYKVKVAYRQDTGPSGIAIEIKNKSNGNVVFDSLRSINGSNVKLIPVTSGKYALNEFSKNSAESQIFLQRSGVFPENIKDNSTTNIEWSNVYINESGDYEISASADDQMVLEVLIANALPVEVNTQQSKTSTSSQNTQSRKVFNTVDYISKADRQLWRLDPRAGRDAGFINQYGVLPFDPNSDRAQSDDFSGTHVIRWEYVDFPVDGNYNIEIMVDDNVTLYIGNRDGGGAKEIGNGLRPIDQGGDEVIITKRGFSSPGRSTGKSLETRFFKAGKYRIRAELEQINVGPLAKGNPMALAVNIETSFTEEEVISAKSWNENPMGGALTIDAPIPPIPQEPIPPQEGRCPNNPIWTTRFPGAKEKWWPVKFQNAPGLPSWSRFMNRYAISPIPPLAKPGSDGGGIVYRNQWDIDIPYDGFYAFKSTVDNAGRILIDGKPIMQANYIPTTLENTRGGSGSERRSGIAAIGSDGIIFNWRENNPKSKKIFLSKGLHKIEIEVENGKTNTFQKIDKKVFSTKDWLFPSKPTQTTQSITTTTSKKIICHAGGGSGGNLDGIQNNVGTVKVGNGGNGGPGSSLPGNLDHIGGAAGLRSGSKPTSPQGVNLDGNVVGPTFNASRTDLIFGLAAVTKTSGSRQGFGFGGDGTFPGVYSPDRSGSPALRAARIEASSGGSGAVRIKYAGKTQEYTTPGTYEFIVPEGITSIDVACIGGGGSGYDATGQGTGRAGLDGGGGGAGGAYAYVDGVGVTAGSKLKVVVGVGGIVPSKRSANGGDSYVEIGEQTITSTTTTTTTTDTTTEIISTSKTSPGVVYEGPTPIVNYRGDFISPVLQNVNAFPNEEVQGKTWIFRWTNVDFPVDGQYTLESEADDQLIVRIDGNEVGVSKVFEGRRKINFNATKGKRTVELELSNIRIPDTGFEQNPVVGFAQITVPVDVATGVGQPWITNPIGISAILIPPPCPKKVTGKGVVCRVVVDDPGNGYPITRGPGYPAALRLRSVEVENTGINYNCGVDQIQITPSNGAQLGYECDTFGRITRVNVLNPGLGFTEYPEISIVSPPGVEPTGVNATFRPQFEIVRDPIVVDPDIIIQVTDLVGLKQTGYVDGRPYYGAVYYKDGVRYAGFYQTPGELVQVYDTLQESIDGVVVTRPSAIQRQGTDISSNDPRLNIPGTPNEII
jgi:hypothetical protein